MKHYTTDLLWEPVSVKWAGRRSVQFSALVLENGRPYSIHETENAARAYATRLNKIEREMHESLQL